MPTVVQANAQKRLDFVLPKMKKHKDLLVWVVMNALTGGDRAFLEFKYKPLHSKWFDNEGAEYTLDFVLDAYESHHLLRQDTVIDAYIPWLANRLNKYQGHETDDGARDLVKGFHSIAIWASETKTDLNKLSLEEALDQSADYVPNAKRKGKEDSEANPVIYRFADGHKVVELKTDDALKREGDVMKHCVGDYCDAVKEGLSIIYSLRDQAGKSLVTMEYEPKKKHFSQILGPSNVDPTEDQNPLILEFLKAKFPHDVLSILDMGGTVDESQKVDLTGVHRNRLIELARDPRTPGFLLSKLADDEDYAYDVGRNPNTPLETLVKIAEATNQWYMAASVASNSKAPAAVLEKIASRARPEHRGIWRALALNPNTPPYVLDALTEVDENAYLVALVATNPNTPPALQVKIINKVDNHYQKHWRQAIASNDSLSEEAVKLLMSPEYKTIAIKEALANNPATPSWALQQIVDEAGEDETTYSRYAQSILDERHAEQKLTNREKVAAALMIVADYLESNF